MSGSETSPKGNPSVLYLVASWSQSNIKVTGAMHYEVKIFRNVIYYGRDEPLLQRRRLRAGPLSMVLEGGDLRNIRLGDIEVLRRVYMAVRDRNWGTILPTFSDWKVRIQSRSFQIYFLAKHKQGEIDFSWRGSIKGSRDGEVSYSMDGRVRRDFYRNRIGICVLHPIKECAGRDLEEVNVDRSSERKKFPFYISPHQPLFDIREIRHEVLPGIRASVRFEGEVFEMEDQRNWTDMSYKTYSTPLKIPYPVLVRKGERVKQSISLTLQAKRRATAKPLSSKVTISTDTARRTRLPKIGLCVASHGRNLSTREVDALTALRLDHLRVDLNMASGEWRNRLESATRDAERIGASTEVAAFVSDSARRELSMLRGAFEKLKPRLSACLVFHKAEKSTSERWLRLAKETLHDYGDLRIGGGTDANFCELNRSRPPVSSMNLVAYSANPQIHAFDNASMVENLEGLAWTVLSARQFCDGAPIAVTPITLRQRYNPYARTEVRDNQLGGLPPNVDPRQLSLFGACWTAGSIKYLGESGASSATYYETTGWLGVMETEKGSAVPDFFRSRPSMLYPLYHVLADLGEVREADVIRTVSSDPLTVDAMCTVDGKKTRTFIMNMTMRPQYAVIKGLKAGSVKIRRLNEKTFERATIGGESFRTQENDSRKIVNRAIQMHLLPFEVARLDY